MIITNVWGSVIKLCQEIITSSASGTELFDWETHAEDNELPKVDLIGPASIAVEEETKHIVSVVFAIAGSSYDDDNLFRQRAMMAQIFERLRAENSFGYYNADTAQLLGWMKITEGTVQPPMSRAQLRPWQYVQARALIDPMSVPA